jgi:hypothetical protein
MLEKEAEHYERSLDRIVALMTLMADAEYLGNDDDYAEYESRLEDAITDRDDTVARISDLGGVVLDGAVLLP